MTNPKLPPLQPPQIPNSWRKNEGDQQPPKSNFFFVLTMTFLIIWTFQMFKAPKDENNVVEVEPSAAPTGAAPTLTDVDRAALPEEFVAAADQANDVRPEYVSLGSLDPNSPYRTLVTLSNRGAAVSRVELNEAAYADNSDSTGYMGQIVVDEGAVSDENVVLGLPGVEVQVVGAGTPAALAGLKPGDRIVGIAREDAENVVVERFETLRDELLQTRPGDKIKLEVYRGEELNKDSLYRNLKISLAQNKKKSAETAESAASVSRAEVASSAETTGDAETTSVAETAGDAENASDASSAETGENATVAQDGETAKDAGASEAAQEVADADAPSAAPVELKFECPKETVEVVLQRAPLSVLAPNGTVRNYADYVARAGLQGATYEYDDKFDFFDDNVENPQRKLNGDPASFLTTLAAVDGEKLTEWAPVPSKKRNPGDAGRPEALEYELPGIDMRNGYWDYVADESSENVAVFRKILLSRKLEVVKKYELVPENVDKTGKKVKSGRGYHLTLSVAIKNFDPSAARTVSYLLDGPTGLPLEGAWFSSGRKTGPGWGAYGLRDLVVSMNDGKSFHVVKCWDIAQDKLGKSDELGLDFLGVDGQYFQCTAIPVAPGDVANDEANAEKNADATRFAYSPIRVGARVKERPNFADVSFRLKSGDVRLAPRGQDGDSFEQQFLVFAGPKQRQTLAEYGLSKTLVYGWFWFVAIPLLWILHFLHDYVVFNYGLAIVLLTILVRLCVYPLSRKQVASSMKMQQLQPAIAQLKERYKDDPQGMMAAQQALFKKYGVNPLSGCLPIFIQMPIFIGLYKALSLDVNLYGAPLFAKSVRWCSNLAAPDMAFDWSGFWTSIGWPSFNMSGQGFLSLFSLGPFLNILPVITIALFLIQQKLLVPPVVGDDEQARQQRSMRKMMNFMMIFMGLMFFKVPSGLCVYFIVSSLWGLLERKMLPKKDKDLAPIDASTLDVEAISQTAGVAGFESKKDKLRKFATTGRKYEKYEIKRDKKGRRILATQNEKPKSKLRAWWDDVVEKAKEQQKLAKAEYEDGIKKGEIANRRRRRG